MVVDCRSLIEFCRAFEHHRRSGNPSASNGRRNKSLNPFSHPFCEHSPFAAIDIIILLLGLGALGILAFPYIELIFNEACGLLPETFDVIGDVIHNAPLAYAAGFVLMFAAAIVAWELIDQRSRKCGNPYCQGLRKAVEFDIQLESEECVKYLPAVEEKVFGSQPPELGQDHKELEAELKKMAPLNGRTVLIFRKRCGCPIGRMEVWGAKKVRRIKK